MGVFSLFLICAIVGFMAWGVCAAFNPAEPIRRIIYGLAILIVLLIVVRALGVDQILVPKLGG